MMKKHLLLTLCLTLTAASVLFGQPEKELENAVRIYNNLREFTGKLKSTTITDADIKFVDDQVKQGLSLLDPLVRNTGSATAEVAGYFRMNFIYEQGFILGMKGRQKDALALYEGIETDMNGFTSGRFPLRYSFEGKNYVINWDNFAPTQGEFNVGMCEFYYNKKDYAKALPYARKAAENGTLSSWLKVLNYRWLLNMKIARGENDREQLDAALNAFEAYTNLSEEDRASGGDNIAKVPDECADAIETMLKAFPAFANGGETWARASRLLTKEKRDPRALQFATKALQAGYRDRGFAEETANKAIAAGDRGTAGLAINLLASLTAADDCQGLSNIARLYLQAGDKAKGNTYTDKANSCERQQRHRLRAATREGGLYLGAYVIPLFRRDWGLVASIQTRKVLLEGSYQVANHNRDYMFDQQLHGEEGARDEKNYWDGYYAHFAINGILKGGKRSERTYMGILFGYNVREFEAFSTNVYDQNNVLIRPAEFKPKDTRYILMYNTGLHANGRLLASDFFFSIGGSYNLFDRGNQEFNEGDYHFDKILLKRKDTRFGFMIRIGFTVGLQIGPRTFGN